MADLGKLTVAIAADATSFHSTMSRVDKDMDGLGTKLGSVGKMATVLGGALAAIGLANFVKNVTMTAARTETLGVVLKTVGKNAGYSDDELSGYEKSVKELGITTQVTRTVLTRMMQAQIDLTHAEELANVARNAAVIANENTSDSLEAILHGITSLQPEILRTRGLVINLQAAYVKEAKTLGIATTALTTRQKQQIAMNEVLKAGVAIEGTYEEAMGTAGKKVASLDRLMEEASETLGKMFLPAFGKIVDTVSNFVETLSSPEMDKAMENIGKSLAGSLKDPLGAVGDLIEAFGKLPAGAIEAIIKISGAIVGTAGLVFALSKAVAMVQALSAAFAVLHVAALGPIGLIVAALGGLAYAGYKGNEAIENMLSGQEAGTKAAYEHAQAELELGKALYETGEITQDTYDELVAITDAHKKAYEAAEGLTDATKKEGEAVDDLEDHYARLQRKVKDGSHTTEEATEASRIYRKQMELTGDSVEAYGAALAYLEPAIEDVTEVWQEFADEIKSFSESKIDRLLLDLGNRAKQLEINIRVAGGKGADAAREYEDELEDVETQMYLLERQSDISFGAQKKNLGLVTDAAETAEDAYNDILSAMRNIADFAFPGEMAMSDQLFAMQQDAKRLELQILEMGGRGAEGVEPLEDELENLRRQMDMIRLQGELTWDPMRRLIERVMEPIQEMGLGEKLNSMLALSPETLSRLWEACDALGQQSTFISTLGQMEGRIVNPNLTPQYAEWEAQKQPGETLEDFSRHLAAIGAPSFQYGGIVPGPIGMPKLVMAHGGEEFAGVGNRLNAQNTANDNRSIVINVNGSGEPAGVVDRFVSDPRVMQHLRPRAAW